MKKFGFIGDVHGNAKLCIDICQKHPNKTFIQVGDFGLGFFNFTPPMPSNFFMIHGNHDNPNIKPPYSLGRFGLFDDIFFVSGAMSTDAHLRTIGNDFWVNEELSFNEGNVCLNLCQETLPNIVISHDGPSSAIQAMFGIKQFTFTNKLLEEMLQIHTPDVWIFGHHHESLKWDIFICLDIEEVIMEE